MNLKKSLFRNWLSLLGIVLSLGALFVFVLLFVVDLFFGHASPWFSLLAYVCVPAVLAGGLGLLVVGLILQYWLDNRLPMQEGCGCWGWLRVKLPPANVDFTKCSTWWVLISILAVAGISASVVTVAGYKVYHWSEADEFCGELCHTPMEPENVAHQTSAHAKIHCVECHVGPGVESYAFAKMNGIRQLAQAVTKTYHTPIHVPVSALYGRHLDGKTKIEHTCMECHWNDQYVGLKAKSYTHFLKNEEDIKTSMTMTLNVGGSNPEKGPVGGIHWHVAPGNKVEFVTADNKRQGAISWVRVTTPAGGTNVFAKEGVSFDSTKQKLFTMTCLECHNRPAHQYASPTTAVDLAMEIGTLPVSLGDNVKATVIELLTGTYQTKEQALKAITDGMTDAFDGEALPKAIATVQSIYSRNIFPEMKASWAAYPDYLGHKDTLGCARCHNEGLVNKESDESVRKDCKLCHLITSQFKDGEWDESDVKGLEFKHPDGSDKEDITACSRCHDGTY